jgi:MFS family permease
MTRRLVLLAAWPLLAGLSSIMIGNGLQGTLLGLRASSEEFNTFSIGVIMSMYFVGFLAGSLTVPDMIRNVGHIRVFTAMTAIASTTILAHGVFPSPVLWTIARGITGFSFAGLYVVIESWINSLTNRKTRGSILAIYLVIHYIALALGQLCLYIAPPETIEPFILTSVFVSLAAIPVALSRKPAPSHEESERLSLREIWRISPTSFYSIGISALCVSVLYTIAPVYGAAKGLATQEIANFMALFLMGGICGQLPIGYISDNIGRRKTIIAVTALTALMALLCYIFAGTGPLLNFFFFMLGTTSLTVYAQGSAMVIDYLPPSQYLSAAGSMMIISSAGSIIGPILFSGLIGINADTFFPGIAAGYISITIFALYRSTIREALPAEEQEGYFNAPSGGVITQVATRMAVKAAGGESIRKYNKSVSSDK